MSAIPTTPTTVRPAKSYARNRPQTRARFGQLRAGPRFVEDFVPVARPDPRAADTQAFSLYYRVYHPSRLHSAEAPPLVVVHGGPSLPSDYLHPLALQFSSRAVVFYDQLGCGRSSRPEERCLYSIEHSVQDLQDLVRALQLEKFHLLGHSFGGLVAYEYLAAGRGGGDCLSLTLHSTPSNMRTSLDECARLEDEVRDGLPLDHAAPDDADRAVRDALRLRHECRLDPPPAPLVAARAGRGAAFGPDDVADHVARPPPRGAALPPVLAVRGQHDFVTEACVAGWRGLCAGDASGAGPRGAAAYREEVLRGCAHYGHLEDARAFGDLVGGHCFVHDY